MFHISASPGKRQCARKLAEEKVASNSSCKETIPYRKVCIVITQHRNGEVTKFHTLNGPDPMAQWQDCLPGCWEGWGPEFNPRPGRVGV